MSTRNEFCKNFKNKPKESLRKIGLELEFPTVNSSGNAVSYSVIRSLFSYLTKAGWEPHRDEGTNEVTCVEKNINKGLGRFGYNKDVISTDVGHCTIEIALTPENDLHKLEEHWLVSKNIIVPFLNKHKCYILGYGVQPIDAPNKTLIANKGRYIFLSKIPSIDL